MRDDEASRRSFFRFALVPIALCIASLARAENQESAGAVEEVRGEAFAENGAQRRMLERAAPVHIPDSHFHKRAPDLHAGARFHIFRA